MLCENNFCLYQANGKCKLKEVEINNIGACSSCICIDIPKIELDKLKNKTLQEIENRYK